MMGSSKNSKINRNHEHNYTMSSFLKPKKYDPDHARRTLLEETQRREKEQIKIKITNDLNHQMKLSLGLTEKENYEDEDSLPSASDTSDEEEDSDEEDGNNYLTYGGKHALPMRQYELLQRRYLRAMSELHSSGERERNNEGLLVKLKLMSKQQTSILKRSMNDRIEAKDKLITTMLTTMRQLNAEEQLLNVFENEHAATKNLALNKMNISNNTSQLEQQNTDKEEMDVLRISLNKSEACNLSLETENEALRQSLSDLGTEDPSVLVLLKEELRTTRKNIVQVKSTLDIMKVELEENERAAALVAVETEQEVTNTVNFDAGVEANNDGKVESKAPSQSSNTSKLKSATIKSNEQKLLKELKKYASKVKKLEAGKMALMNILKEAQSELTKRRATGADDGGSGGGGGGGSSGSNKEQEAILKKKDKSIKKLKSQVKQLSNLLREVEAKRQATTEQQLMEQKEDTTLQQQDQQDQKELLKASNATIALIQKEKSDSIEQYRIQKETQEKKMQTLKNEIITAQQNALKLSNELKDKTTMIDNMRRSTSEKHLVFQNNILELEKQLKKTQKTKSSLNVNIIALHQLIKKLSMELKNTKQKIQQMLHVDIPEQIQQVSHQLSSRLTKQLATFQGLADKYKREYRERKRLFNVVQELRGNIRVFCRVRPISSNESKNGNHEIISYPKDEDNELIVTRKDGRLSKFEFDQVFKPGSTNTDVFNGVEDLCMSVLDGYNVCIFAYGQTGSGKTHTMEGPSTDRGINFRSLQRLFQLKQQREEEFEYKIEVSLLEIYNEEIKDLLMDSKKAMKTKLEVKRDSKKGQYVPGLTMVECHSHQDVLAIMKHGYQNRSVHGTDMNAHSSRSHCALSVYVTAQSIIDGKTTRGKLHLIDLAGSERLSKSKAEGDRKKEAQAINKSLSALGDVISARMKKQKHIPFRNSTLTYLLQDSLSNNSKTLMIVQASPVDYNLSETQATLTWGQRARSVELGKAKKNN